MPWNHRVVKQILDDGTEWFSIREVYYNGNGAIYAYTKEPIDMTGESIEELRKDLKWCLDCLDQPVLEEGKILEEME